LICPLPDSELEPGVPHRPCPLRCRQPTLRLIHGFKQRLTNNKSAALYLSTFFFLFDSRLFVSFFSPLSSAFLHARQEKKKHFASGEARGARKNGQQKKKTKTKREGQAAAVPL
jgi:hypothetical protein